MLESLRNVGRIIVGLIVGTQGLVLMGLGFVALLSLYDLFVIRDIELFLTHLFFVGVIGGGVFFLVWMSHNAASELKNIQTQKEEMEKLPPKETTILDVPTKEPWLYP